LKQKTGYFSGEDLPAREQIRRSAKIEAAIFSALATLGVAVIAALAVLGFLWLF